jgi:hypothetical protein
MLEIFGTNYYIDVDAVIETCRPVYINTPSPEKVELVDETGEIPDADVPSGAGELNIFKFEVFKSCIERVLGEYEEVDDNLGTFVAPKSPSFKIAFNTLLKYEILKENDEQ